MVRPALAERLAAWFDALRWEALPAAQRELAALRVLDTLGLIAGAARLPATAAARAVVAGSTADGGASVAGLARRIAPSGAALVHGVAAHALDFDDTFPASVVHPGSAIVPTALAVGEATGASGREVLLAVAGGYELVARLAAVGGKRFHARGFHPSGVFAPLGAAFVAARLARLEPPVAASAVGLATSMAGGLLAFLPDGAWSKWLHLGWGNHGGIVAGELAAQGFRGPLGGLDGRHNLFATFVEASDDETAAVDEGLGARWQGDDAVFKRYPCAHVIQGYIDLALALRQEAGLSGAEIACVTCAVAPWAVPIVCEPAAEKLRPSTSLQAIASLPHHLAAAFVDGRVDVDTIDEARLGRDDLAAVAARIGYRLDPELPGFAAGLTVETHDGRRFERSGDAAANAVGPLREKFRALASRVAPPTAVGALEEAVADIADAPNVSSIARFLRQIESPAT